MTLSLVTTVNFAMATVNFSGTATGTLSLTVLKWNLPGTLILNIRMVTNG